MHDDNSFYNIYRSIKKDVNYIKVVDSDSEMDKEYVDEYTTHEQKERDKEITKLLQKYVENYSEKVKSNVHYKKVIVYSCILILVIFVEIGRASCRERV